MLIQLLIYNKDDLQQHVYRTEEEFFSNIEKVFPKAKERIQKILSPNQYIIANTKHSNNTTEEDFKVKIPIESFKLVPRSMAPKPIEVILNKEDLEKVERLAIGRNNGKSTASQLSINNHRQGLLGELACSKLFNVGINEEFYGPKGDGGGADIILNNGKSVQIKTKAKVGEDCIVSIRELKKLNPEDYIILCHIVNEVKEKKEEEVIVNISGFLTKQEYMIQGKPTVFWGKNSIKVFFQKFKDIRCLIETS